MENTALLTDNKTLSQNNFFLQGLLKQQQNQDKGGLSVNSMSALSGVSMFCVVFSVSFFNDFLPSSFFQGFERSGSSISPSQAPLHSFSGRVLSAISDEESYDGLISLGGANHSNVACQYMLLACLVLVYFFYVQYNTSVQKKSKCILP